MWVWPLHRFYLEVVRWSSLSFWWIYANWNILLKISAHCRFLIKTFQEIQVILIDQYLLMWFYNLLNLVWFAFLSEFSSRNNNLLIILRVISISLRSGSWSTTIGSLRPKETISCYFSLMLNIVFLSLWSTSLL